MSLFFTDRVLPLIPHSAGSLAKEIIVRVHLTFVKIRPLKVKNILKFPE